jgi:hypothetical protein
VSALSSACTRWMWCRTSSIGISGFVLTIAGRIFRCPASPLLPRPFSAGHETFVPILAGTPKRPGPTQ